MSEIQPYVFPVTGQAVRTVLVDDEPWFVAVDVCNALSIANVSQSVSYLDDDERATLTTNEGRPLNIISEAGLYSLILRSRKPEAKAFKRWITHDVLPALRRTGRYELAPQHRIPQSFAEALELAARQAREIDEQRAEIERQAPRVRYVEQFVEPTQDATQIGDFAKEIGLSPTRLREWLVSRRLIFKDRYGQYKQYEQIGHRRNWFVLREQPEAPRLHNGQVRKTLYVTPVGKVGICALLDEDPLDGQGVLAV